MSGAANYNGPLYLLEHDVILVTPNYRVGPLGKKNFYVNQKVRNSVHNFIH